MKKNGQISIANLQVAIATCVKKILKKIHTMPKYNPNINNNLSSLRHVIIGTTLLHISQYE
jgi:hypothetical protein